MRVRYLEQTVKAIRESEDAFLCSGELEFRGETIIAHELWIPKSQIHEDSHDEIEEAFEGDVIEIFVSEWWLDKKF